MSTSDGYDEETFVLKVHMNCQGCINKVRKVLRKIEGVYKVDIDAEGQKAIVTGNVNSATLIQKLAKLGKHAEILNAEYNQEQDSHGRGENNDHTASENQDMIPAFFGKDHWGPEGYYHQDMGAKTMESEMHQRFAAPLFFENAYNRANPNFTSFTENPMIRPESFQEKGASDYFGLGSQEWAQNFFDGSSISEYGYEPSLMPNIHGYYHSHPLKMMPLSQNFFDGSSISEYGYEPSLMANIHGYYHSHPLKMMPLSSYNHLPYGINIHMQEPPTRNDLMMKTYMLQHMAN
ncbi:uncharacterized protein LOC130724893 [Lotus japonicus]|uniref:uncharacterized protein LOC130724893 n=1 Tax=Lotus japonicus TaxID=34305 RepID=UPI002584BE37|nr:uncharacterized protein LOC130724893 [Lotus japonicus]